MRPRTPCSQEATSRQRRLETDTTVSHPQHVVLKPVRKQATQRRHRTSQVCQSSVPCLIFAPPTPQHHTGNSNCTLTAPPARINQLARVSPLPSAGGAVPSLCRSTVLRLPKTASLHCRRLCRMCTRICPFSLIRDASSNDRLMTPLLTTGLGRRRLDSSAV